MCKLLGRCNLMAYLGAFLVLLLSLLPEESFAQAIGFNGADCNQLKNLGNDFTAIYESGLQARVSQRASFLVTSQETLPNGQDTTNVWYKGVLPWAMGPRTFSYTEKVEAKLQLADRFSLDTRFSLGNSQGKMSIRVRDYESVRVGSCTLKTLLVSIEWLLDGQAASTTRHSIYAPDLMWIVGWSVGSPPATFKDAKNRVTTLAIAK